MTALVAVAVLIAMLGGVVGGLVAAIAVPWRIIVSTSKKGGKE